MAYIPNYVSRSRHGIYYFRFPLPITMHPQGRRDYIRLSLKTHSAKKAVDSAQFLRHAMAAFIRKLERTNMNFIEKKEIIRNHFLKLLNEWEKGIDEKGGLPKKQIDDIALGLQVFKDIEKAGSLGTYTPNEPAMLQFFNESAIDLPSSGEEREQLIELYNRALSGANKAILTYHEASDRFDYSKTVSKSAQAASEVLEEGGTFSLKEVMSKYFEENENQWKPSTVKSYNTYKNFLFNQLGENTLIREIDISSARHIRESLKVSTRKTKTKNEYLSFYYTFFNWSCNNGYSAENLFQNMDFKRDKNEKKHEHFTKEHLELIESKLLERRNTLPPHSFWCTMIGLYTGARLGEIAQLHKSDIYQEGKNWIISINEEDGKTVKTESSVRNIPMHSELIKLGLPNLVQNSASGMLFPELKKKPQEQDGRKVSRWFNVQFLVALGIKTKLVNFHSFRRSMVTTLLQSDIPEPKVKAIVGHQQEGITQIYNTGGYTLIQLQKAIEHFKVK